METDTGTITSLVADQDGLEACHLYFIERNEKKILYGNDTGWFSEKTWDWPERKRT